MKPLCGSDPIQIAADDGTAGTEVEVADQIVAAQPHMTFRPVPGWVDSPSHPREAAVPRVANGSHEVLLHSAISTGGSPTRFASGTLSGCRRIEVAVFLGRTP